MSYKREFYIFLATAVLAGLVFILTGSNIEIKIGKKEGNVAGANLYGPSPQAPVVDSMADHHKPKPADSQIFDNLLGKAAPDFTLESYDGKKYTLSSFQGKKVILFFNEGLMCYPACWNQVAAFGSDKDLLNKAVVLNINVDPKDEWKKAVDKMPELAKSIVLLDTDRRVSGSYGVLTLTSSMHRGQFPGHSYVVIDKAGIVRKIWDDSEMAVRNKQLAEELDKI